MEAAEPLLTGEQLAQLRTQALQYLAPPTRLATSARAGQRRSRLRGQGLEREDSRPYRPGDDVRYMDWRATARSGRPMMQVLLEERQRTLILVVDRGPSMNFGTRRQLKAAMAARVAALLTFATLQHHEPVGAVAVEQTVEHVPPSRSQDRALALLQHLCRPLSRGAPPAPQRWLRALDDAAALSRAGDLISVISDFRWLDQAGAERLAYLREHRDVAAIQILDRSEMELSAAGTVRMQSPAGGAPHLIDLDDARLRQAFAAAAAQRQERIVRRLESAGVANAAFYTDEDPGARLQNLW